MQTTPRTRSGGRDARRAFRSAPDFSMLPGLTRALPTCEVMDEEQVRRIDEASMAILETVGIVFRDPVALEDWRRAGAEISLFSPLADEGPNPNAGFIFLPGGYPELHAGAIAAAHRFKTAMRDAMERGAVIFGECGGYMVLGEGLEDASRTRHAMCGLLRLETSFARRKLHLGYRNVTGLAGRFAGQQFAAHEFHYSVALKEEGQALFSASDALGADLGSCGLVEGSVSGSYMHLIDQRGEI